MKWFWNARREAAEEIRTHLEERVDDLIESGLPEREAEQQARREFGNPVMLTESSREIWGWVCLDQLGQDLRYAWRMMQRSPGFTAVAVLSLALGIGANTAIFTLLESVLWKPVPVSHPETLRLLSWSGRDNFGKADVNIWTDGDWPWGGDRPKPDGGIRHAAFTWPMYEEFQRKNEIFETLFGFRDFGRVTTVVGGTAESVRCLLVAGQFYQGTGTSTILGRSLGPENDVVTAEGAVAVISYDYWTRRFGRDRSVIGKTIVINQWPVTIIGVNAARFTGITPGTNFEVWMPLRQLPRISPQQAALTRMETPEGGDLFWLPIIGRLKPGVSDAQAQSALDVIFQRQLDLGFPGMRAASRAHLQIESGVRGMDQLRRYGEPLLLLLTLAGMVLLITCANVANLLLAKSAVRQREISLRLALGAGRSRIVRQLFTEGLLLAGVAGTVGLTLGYATRNSVPALLATSWSPGPFKAEFDPAVLLISLSITFLTGILFSLAPVWQVRRVEVNDALKDGGKGTTGLSRLRVGKVLVVVQVAFSLLLLVGAGLFAATFTNLNSVPLGFKPERVLLFRLSPPLQRYPKAEVSHFYASIRDRIGSIPGVEAATYSRVPLLGRNLWSARIFPTGRQVLAGGASMAPDVLVGDHFHETMGIPILYGRALDERDGGTGLKSVVVSAEFGRHFLQSENPLGATFAIRGEKLPYTIVGVCGDGHYDSLRWAMRQTIFRYYPRNPGSDGVTFEVKIAGDIVGVTRQIQQTVHSLDSELPVMDVRLQEEQIASNYTQERLLAALGLAFGGLALLLACIGIYGVMAYTVTRRTNEIGIRVALGANPGGVAWAVLQETLILAAAGIAIGVPAAMGLSKFAIGFLFGLKANDLRVAGAAAIILLTAGAAAAWFPARRAAGIDPAVALRHE